MLRITFESYFAYRNLDEGDLLRTLPTILHLGESSPFVVDNSEFMNWFNHESVGRYADMVMTHYAIYTSNDCIDMLADAEPLVEWL
jgi:hypothetical protein